MSITVGDFLSRVALDLHETDFSFSSGLWTQPEVISYLDYAERDFTTKTGTLKVDESITIPPGNNIIFSRPNDSIDMERISFNRVRLRRVTSWDLERENPSWRSQKQGQPHYYHEDRLNVNFFEIDRIPAAGGTLRIFSDKLPPEHTGSLSEELGVEDFFEQYIRWCVLGLCLGKDGDSQDTARSAYAFQRYNMGVQLAKRLILGTGSITVGAVAQ